MPTESQPHSSFTRLYNRSWHNSNMRFSFIIIEMESFEEFSSNRLNRQNSFIYTRVDVAYFLLCMHANIV